MEQVTASASEAADGSVTITLGNMSCTEAAEICLSGVGRALKGKAEFALLAADDVHACNTFENPVCVQPVRWEGKIADGDTVSIPAGGILAVTIRA